jgi:hypothetical protein
VNRAAAPVTPIEEMSFVLLSISLGVSAIRHPDVMEYLRQAGIVEVNRRAEHCGVPGLQMVCDDARLGIPDLRRREQGLLTVDALDSVDHSSSSEHLPRWLSTPLYVGMGWMAGCNACPSA